MKIFGNRINLDDVEQFLRENGYDCACAGDDDNLKIYVPKLNEKSQIQNLVSKRLGIYKKGFSIHHRKSFEPIKSLIHNK